MSQAVTDFREALKAALDGIEDRLEKAKAELEHGAAHAREEARKQLAAATEDLATFRAKAAELAQALSADIPDKAKPLQDKLQDFGQEAQVAMRHAVVFLAEVAAKGAGGASVALQVGAHKAKSLADNLRRETAVTVVEEPSAEQPGA